MQGTAEEILIHANEFAKTKHKLNEILVKHTGQDLATIEKDTDRDNVMSADEAGASGLIDKSVDSMPRDGEKAE
ncbi:MAG: ATP-dependent Clp protease proteolytic subunit, partial [Planctomycetota bacterium]